MRTPAFYKNRLKRIRFTVENANDNFFKILLMYTVEPLNKEHFGANSFVPHIEVVPIPEGPLSEVPLYVLM